MRRNCAMILVSVLFVIGGCATLPTDYERIESHAYSDTANTTYGKRASDMATEHPGKSGFRLLGNGLDAFVARVVLAEHAERSIDVQYYLYHDDLVARLFTEQLLKAADRGVRVRLLVDDMAIAGRDLSVAVADSHPNMEVRIFNPFSRKTSRLSQFITRMGSVTRRMHNKSFTVDNQVTIVGGRNIGNEYFEANPELDYADLDVMVIGPVVQEVSTVFDLYWNSELAYPALVLTGESPTPEQIRNRRQELKDFVAQQADSQYLQALQNSTLANQIRQSHIRQNELIYHWGDAEVVYDEPEKLLQSFDKTEYHLGPMIAPYFHAVEEELIIFSPYFVPGKKGTAFLSQLSQRGVRVRILTNSLASNDVPIVHAGYAKYRKRLLRAGVELYELNKKLSKEQRKEKKGVGGSSKAALHAKSFVFDRKQAFIGSLNLDPRAYFHNTEIGIVLASAELANIMGDAFDQNIDKRAFRLELYKDPTGNDSIRWHGQVDGKQRSFVTDPYVGFWRRFSIDLLGILPIESQL